jgi:hypothetical protein
MQVIVKILMELTFLVDYKDAKKISTFSGSVVDENLETPLIPQPNRIVLSTYTQTYLSRGTV